MRRTLGLMLIALSMTACTSSDISRETPTEIELHDYQSLLHSVDVAIGGGDYRFLFDTGGGVTVISPDVAEKLGCRAFGRTVAFRMEGERVSFPSCGVGTVSVSGVDLEVELFIMDIASLLPEGWPAIDGVLSLHTFAARSITIDIANRRVVMETDASLAERTATMTPVRTRESRQSGGASLDLFVEVPTSEGSLWFEVDSAAVGPVPAPCHTASILGWQLPLRDPATVTDELKGLGAVQFDAYRKDIIYDGVLGQNALKQMVLTVDLAAGKSWASAER